MKKRIAIAAAITASLALWAAVWPQTTVNKEMPAPSPTPPVTAPQATLSEPTEPATPLTTERNFIKVLRDCWYVERFDIDRVSEKVQDERIITIYQTDIDVKQLLAKFGINIVDDRILDSTTIRLYPAEVNQLIHKADYLISMSVTDLSKLTRDDILECMPVEDAVEDDFIPSPSNEPIVGVIDTQFDETVYFREWVDYHKAIDDSIPLQPKDYYHGTAVTSIIVDGPRGNLLKMRVLAAPQLQSNLPILIWV